MRPEARHPDDHGQGPLTPEQAQEVVDQLIQVFGLDALPKVTVRPRPDGLWQVRWTHHEAVIEPPSMRSWRRWLERNVGPLNPERLTTSEG